MQKRNIISIFITFIILVSNGTAFADVYNILNYDDNSGAWDTALSNALNDLLNDDDDGGVIYFPPGLYDFQSKVSMSISDYSKSIVFQGEGSSVTTIRWSDSSEDHGFYINYTGANGFYESEKGVFKFEKMTLLTNGTTETAIEIECSNGAGPTPQKAFSDLVIAGTSTAKTWATGIALTWCPFTNIDDIKFQGRSDVDDRVGTAILIDSGTDYFITRVRVVNANIAVNVIGSTEGVNINDSIFLKCDNGLHWNTTIWEPYLTIHNTHISSFQNGIILTNGSQGFVSNCLLTQKVDSRNTNWIGILLNTTNSYIDHDGVNIHNNMIRGSQDSSFTAAHNGIVVAANRGNLNISGNNILWVTTGIWMKSGTKNCIVQGTLTNDTNNSVLDQGANNYVLNTVNY